MQLTRMRLKLTPEELPEAYAKLSESDMERLCRFGKKRSYQAGEALFSEGQKQASMHALISGRIGIYQHIGRGDAEQIAEITPGMFTGDVSMMSGRATVAEGRCLEPSEVIEVPFGQLKRLLVEDSYLSDIIVSAYIKRRAALSSKGLSSIQLLGSRYAKDTARIREFLTRNALPYNFIDLESGADYRSLLQAIEVPEAETPVMVYKGSEILKNPSNETIANKLGVSCLEEEELLYDVAVVGSGPAGLAASVNAASDGLSVINIDAAGPGGQAGSSSKIENYLGFPMGISGQELANRAMVQAQKFGVLMVAPQMVNRLEKAGDTYHLALANRKTVQARSVVLALGAKYHRLAIDNIGDFEGSSIHFNATGMEAQLCRDEDVAIVGAGNSAGQAAVFLSESCRHVYLVVRKDNLVYKMSNYLIRRIEDRENITVLTQSEVTALSGRDGMLDSIDISDNRSGQTTTRGIHHLFLFLGAKPLTDWLEGTLSLDTKGFIKTGLDLEPIDLVRAQWNLNRMPSVFETTWPRVYAVGDVRSGSSKRVAAAVGEGSMTIGLAFRALNE
ncbi:MAG: FAD-dependent oxidoreductase [Desulfosarcinaceae bacterium]|nr:FAD-dependent oxidoreductase [Desulfosarcinaceae bacterium]